MTKLITKISKKNQANKYEEIKLLNFPLYKKSLEWNGRFIKRTFLNGLFVFQYDTKCLTFSFRLFDVEYFDYNILKTVLRYSYRIWYLFFIPIWIKNASVGLLNSFLKEDIIKKYPNYDDYYVFFSHSGEFFLLMHHFDEWLENNKSKNYGLFFTQKSLYKICQMFYPNIPAYLINTKKVAPVMSRGIKSSHFKVCGKNIYVPSYAKYFQDVEKEILKNNVHYYEYLKKHLNLHECTKYYSISDETKEKVLQYRNNFLGENYVIISPESLSNVKISKEFWNMLSQKIREKGYSIFCNVTKTGNLIEGCVTTFFTYEEAIELAQHSKAIIGLRSGFLECLSQTNIPLVALYTDFTNRPGFGRFMSDKVMSGFSIKKLPRVNKDLLFEYDINDYNTFDEIIDVILKHIV